MRVVVLTVDQRGSSRVGAFDQVSQAIDRLTGVDTLCDFERTAGDEFQGVLVEPQSLTRAVEALLREDQWNIGVGIGDAEEPLPASTREGRGAAFWFAREAVTQARSSPWRVRIEGDRSEARWLESTIWLWAALLGRRTERGWEVSDLVDTGLSYDGVAKHLGITQSAVSQRAQAAGIAEGRRARELVSALVASSLADVAS